MGRRGITALVAVGLALIAAPAAADQLVFCHSGDSNPRLNEWSYDGNAPGTAVGAIDDNGVPAWFVDDNSPNFGSVTGYYGPLTPEHASTATEEGWRMKIRMRVAEASDAPEGSPSARFRTAERVYALHFGSQADGDPIVRLMDSASEGAEYVLEGAGSGYHTYELSFDTNHQSAVLTIDGTEVASGYVGFARTGTWRIAWGVASSGDTGQGNFARAELYLGRRGAVGIEDTSWGDVKSDFARRR